MPLMLRAAEFWATARNTGRQSPVAASLDADMILAAQAGTPLRAGDETVIETTDVCHLIEFAPARVWSDNG
jgi:hypothetical protein